MANEETHWNAFNDCVLQFGDPPFFRNEIGEDGYNLLNFRKVSGIVGEQYFTN